MCKKIIKKLICLLCVLSVLFTYIPINSAVYAITEMSITPSEANGIFEEKDNVECTAKYSSSGTVEVVVSNYYGKNVFSTSWTGSGTESETVSIGKLSTGWYKVTLKTGAKTVSSSFAVVPSLNERYSGESPFSTDMAANSILKDDTLVSNYVSAAKHAGLNWVRERYSWWTKSDGEYDYSEFESAINKQSEAGLDVIAVSTDYSRGGYSLQKQMFTDDLFKVYNYQKDMSAYFGDKVDAWEIWNETDHDNFGEIPADVFSSFYKAAAIAVKDSGSNSRVMFGGLCMYTDASDFAEMMMKNDVMRYSDAYNIHRHLPVYNTNTQAFDTEFVKEHEALMLTSGYNRPIWMTEAGLAMSVVNETNLKKQARYAVTSAIESIASGTDRHFWFILPEFKTGGAHEYGVFNENNLPNPAYASLAIITNILGAGEYKGKYTSSYFNGYVFNNGTNDVLVAWANNSSTLSIVQSYKAYDMMGNIIAGPVTVGCDPIYLVFDSELDTSLYTKAVSSEETLTDDLTAKDRIVIQTDFNGIEDLKDVRNTGYNIGSVETRNVIVKAYNFNDTSVEGVLHCNADGFRITGNEQKITIPAKDSISTVISLTPDTIKENVPQYISFYVTTDEGNTSPTVAKVVKTEGIRIVPKDTAPERSCGGGFWRCDQGLIFDNKNIVIDLSHPLSNPSGLNITNDTVTFMSKDQYVDYEINAIEAGSYYINFKRANAGSGNFYIYAEVNGETVNRKTGRIQNSDRSYTFQNEVQLNKGRNVIRIGNMSSYAGNVSGLTLTKLDSVQYTDSMNVAQGTRSFKSTYKSGLGVDPWLYIDDYVTDYPEGSTAPYVTFEITIPNDGYYYPSAAMSGASKIKLRIADEDFDLGNDSVILSESYKASGSASCKWLRSNKSIYLEKGHYDVTVSLYGASREKWNTGIGAVRFVECAPYVYDQDFTLNIANPQKNNGVEVIGNVLSMTSGDWAEYEVFVSEDASYYVSFNRENASEDKYFNIAVAANGKTVNRKTGRIQNPDESYTFLDELQLKKGKNIIRVDTMGVNGGTVSSMSFTKLRDCQYTTSMNVATGTRTFKSAYKEGLVVDPWLWINDNIADYPEGSTAPYVTVGVEIPKNGYYYPSAATSGANKVKLSIDGESFALNDDCTVLEEKYKASGVSAALCSWLKSNKSIYLEKGNYNVTVSLYGASGEKWNAFIGAIRFIETSAPTGYEDTEANLWAEYDFDVKETGNYCVRFASGGNNSIRLMVNGSHISYKTGRTVNEAYNSESYAKWSLYENTVPLYKGKNTVRIEPMPKSDTNDMNAVLSEILFIKSDDIPKTGITAKAMTNMNTNVDGLVFDPWAYINVEQEDAPYIRWNFEVPDTGYYKVRLAYRGSSKPVLNIAEHSVSFENASKTGAYCLSDYLGKAAPWYEADDVIYLEKGVYETKMSLIPGYLSTEGKWYLGFAGFQLAEIEEDPTRPWVTASKRGNCLSVNYEAPEGTNFDIILADFTLESQIRRMKKIFEPISVYGEDSTDVKTIPVGDETGHDFEVYIWSNLTDMEPILEKVGTYNKLRRLEF